MMGALVYVLNLFDIVSMQIPGHNGLFWVIPIIIGVSVVKKMGAATYSSFIAGILAGLTGSEAVGPFAILEYLVMGLTIDLLATTFRGHLGNIIVGFLLGSAGNLTKMAVHYSVFMILGMTTVHLIAIGLGIAAVSYFVFGGIGGAVASFIAGRCIHSLAGFIRLPEKQIKNST